MGLEGVSGDELYTVKIVQRDAPLGKSQESYYTWN